MVIRSVVWIDPQLMDTHQQRKHKRIMAVAEVIKRRGRVNYKRFLAEMQYHGLRKKVAEEYLEALKDLGMIKFEEGDIVWNGTAEDKRQRCDVTEISPLKAEENEN